MKDIGLGERTGKDDIARRNVIAVSEQLKIEITKLSELSEKFTALENSVQGMKLEIQKLREENVMLRAVNSPNLDGGSSGIEGLVAIS